VRSWTIRRPFAVLLLTVAVLIVIALIIAVVTMHATNSPEDTATAVAFLALLGVLITQVVNTMIAWSTAREDRQQKIESDERQALAEAFTAYFDYVTELLTSSDTLIVRASEKQQNPGRSNQTSSTGTVEMALNNPEISVILRARTLAVLAGGQDRHRKVNVLEFLYESGLIYKYEEGKPAAVNLAGADLRNVDMSDRSWERIDLSATVLADADFRSADLSSANLSSADLEGAKLAKADLSHATVSHEQLAKAASLAGATMPNGQKYDAWLKDRGEDGENSGTS